MAEFEDGINLPQTNNLTPPPGVPSDAFEFESVRDLEIPPNYFTTQYVSRLK